MLPHTVRDYFFWDSRESNYKVDITDVIEIKLEAAYKYTSQVGKGNLKYVGPEMDAETKEMTKKSYSRKDPDGKIYERFRRLQESLSF